jgi:hypothetical protein
MRKTSLIQNSKSIEWKLSLQEAYLFSWMYELPSWANSVIIEGVPFYFASKTKVEKDLPLLAVKLDTIYRYYKSLSDSGLIIIKKIDGKDYIALTEKGKSWNTSSNKNTNIQSEHSEINPNELGNKSENNSDLNPTYNYTNIDSYTNDVVVNKKSTEYLADAPEKSDPPPPPKSLYIDSEKEREKWMQTKDYGLSDLFKDANSDQDFLESVMFQFRDKHKIPDIEFWKIYLYCLTKDISHIEGKNYKNTRKDYRNYIRNKIRRDLNGRRELFDAAMISYKDKQNKMP